MRLPLIEQPRLLPWIRWPSPFYWLNAAATAEVADSSGSGSVCEPSTGWVPLQPWASLGIPAELLFLSPPDWELLVQTNARLCHLLLKVNPLVHHKGVVCTEKGRRDREG
ncbi:hypothetical protein UPYG_G00265070 [Umbra pygmaea]|uniref:Uncharacterized protein n=1 Tax=Umbra pygmaea TaxID=75934 RepID=A0ABD0W9S1_UMBPY